MAQTDPDTCPNRLSRITGSRGEEVRRRKRDFQEPVPAPFQQGMEPNWDPALKPTITAEFTNTCVVGPKGGATLVNCKRALESQGLPVSNRGGCWGAGAGRRVTAC